VPHLVFRCEIDGETDPETGFLCNITQVDQKLRQIILETLIPNPEKYVVAEQMLIAVFENLKRTWAHSSAIARLELALSPYLNYSIVDPRFTMEPEMSESPIANKNSPERSPKVYLTEQFEFSAAHRLHCESMSAERNQEVFGKCNNLEGHGHNYVVEVTISRATELETASESVTKSETEELTGEVIRLSDFESTVKRVVIDRLDHKHLNRDISYFSDINPTVENISVAIFGWLDGQFGAARLEKIRLYETPKTWAEFSGPTSA